MKKVQPAALYIKNLGFSYASVKRNQPVLAIGDLKVAAGAHTLIYGESGCGKSTLLNLLSGILTGHTGTLEVLGSDYAGMKPAQHDRFRAENIAVIFQQFNLIPYLTVRENVLLGARLAGKPVDASRLGNIFEHLQIAGLAHEQAVSLSHGQQQRVAAARAIAQRARLILADEPTSALDDLNSRLFLDLLFREAGEHNTTIVVVSHDLRYKKRFDQVMDLAKINKALRGEAA
jgi:putative ABC transport system ATP-binding protein